MASHGAERAALIPWLLRREGLERVRDDEVVPGRAGNHREWRGTGSRPVGPRSCFATGQPNNHP